LGEKQCKPAIYSHPEHLFAENGSVLSKRDNDNEPGKKSIMARYLFSKDIPAVIQTISERCPLSIYIILESDKIHNVHRNISICTG